MNYLTLVNKENPINDSSINLIDCKDILGEDIKVEETTYKAYLELKKYLETKNIIVGLASGWRSIEEQQRIIDEYTKKYGVDYVNKYVAPIRTSEHHTGLAIDLGLIDPNGKTIIDNDELFKNT